MQPAAQHPGHNRLLQNRQPIPWIAPKNQTPILPNLHTKSPQTPAPTHTDADVSLDRRYIFPLSRCVRDKTSTTPYEVQNNDSPAQEARQQGLHHGS